MDVFISWSGNRSRAVADLLDEWLQCVLQAIDPWMSSKDIDRGSLWFTEISNQLQQTKVGIVCLTRDNINKPWILFEAGALAKGLSSARVCTLLVDLESIDISDPLAQFNHTSPTRDGLFELVRTLNNALGEKALKEKVLLQVFNTYWPQFEIDFQTALTNNPAGIPEEVRTEESLLAELLKTTRSLDRRMRGIEKSVESNDIESNKLSSDTTSRRAYGARTPITDDKLHRHAVMELHDLMTHGLDFESAIYKMKSRYPDEILNSMG